MNYKKKLVLPTDVHQFMFKFARTWYANPHHVRCITSWYTLIHGITSHCTYTPRANSHALEMLELLRCVSPWVNTVVFFVYLALLWISGIFVPESIIRQATILLNLMIMGSIYIFKNRAHLFSRGLLNMWLYLSIQISVYILCIPNHNLKWLWQHPMLVCAVHVYLSKPLPLDSCVSDVVQCNEIYCMLFFIINTALYTFCPYGAIHVNSSCDLYIHLTCVAIVHPAWHIIINLGSRAFMERHIGM